MGRKSCLFLNRLLFACCALIAPCSYAMDSDDEFEVVEFHQPQRQNKIARERWQRFARQAILYTRWQKSRDEASLLRENNRKLQEALCLERNKNKELSSNFKQLEEDLAFAKSLFNIPKNKQKR